MTRPCPECDGTMTTSGLRRRKSCEYRRFKCSSCGYAVRIDASEPNIVAPPPRRFDAQQVRDIVSADESLRSLAKRYGCSSQLISQIRTGQLYRDLLPYGYLPRNAGGPRCDKCRHWHQDHCGLGFPDPEQEGPFFARDCAAWVEGRR